MHFVVLVLLVCAVVFGPSLWVKRVMRRYDQPENRYPSSGADLARHLLDLNGLQEVKVEETEAGDHYDPLNKVVRLAPGRYGGNSLTAVTVAAHEVGHALQDASGYAPLSLRTRLVMAVQPLQKLGALVLMGAPLVAILTRAPLLTSATIVGGLLSLGTATLVHLVTLPTEIDASYRRALPMLQQEGVLIPSDLPHARRILKAAAMTYVAASLVSLLNVARWWAIMRR
jgi:Zn-dependent membrane protease YugP